ncbi:uncharacterized protein LOC126272383 isoform X2 [Schistocerca gregaria]|uniref:uncharacterized protein LOC126272383 isoform X2 n=1 Tax=Schistocerca gregaria TaxID=7010 RepID=UPI00211E1774|nr:uncharacterized protein LOC126272383 isoform X2 [Schistocerca gregaria]
MLLQVISRKIRGSAVGMITWEFTEASIVFCVVCSVYSESTRTGLHRTPQAGNVATHLAIAAAVAGPTRKAGHGAYATKPNGETERFVRTVKKQMAKLRTAHTRDQVLQQFRAPCRSLPRDGPSPAELLHGRRHRTLLHVPQHPAPKEGNSRIPRTPRPQQPPE